MRKRLRGVFISKDAIERSAKEFRKVLDIDVHGHFICSKTVGTTPPPAP